MAGEHPHRAKGGHSVICSKHESSRCIFNLMDEDGGASPELGDRATSDVTVRLKNREGRPEWYHCHAVVLSRRSRFFAERLSVGATPRLSLSSAACVEIPSSGADYDHHVRLLKLLYRSEDPPWESWGSVATALGVLRAAVALGCDCVARSCVQYLEAMPWEEEEEEILRTVKDMGPAAAPILARIQPVDHSAAKEVLIAAIHFAAAAAPAEGTNELKISAQEQVEYMLTEDDEAPLLMADDDVKTEVRADLGRMFSALAAAMASLPAAAEEERRVLQALSDLEWLCGILPKMDLMKDFVSHWVRSSDDLLGEIQSERLCSGFWAVKAKMVELAGKALEAVGYGSVVLPAPARVRLLKGWLPFLRKTKAALDSPAVGEENSVQGLDSELCQTIEGAVVSMVLALPSNDQAEILTDWMTTGQVNFPDLSEAFEVWCYRAKAAKRRLAVGVDGAANPTVSL